MRERAGNMLVVAVTAVLFVTMLVLCGMYIELRLNGLRPSLPPLPERDKWLLTNKSYDSHSGSNTLLSPVMIGEKTGGKAYACGFDGDAYTALTGTLYTNLASLLQHGSAERLALPTKEEKQAFVTLLCSGENFLYAAFYDELPVDVFLPCITGTASAGSVTDHFFVRYVFIVPDENENAYAVCLDNDENATVLRAEGVPYHRTDPAAYTNGRGYVPFAFLREGSPAAVFTSSFTVDSVVLAPGQSFFRFSLDDENTVSLLSSFGLNPNLVKSFRSRDDSSVNFVEDAGELYIDGAVGRMTYRGTADGVPFSSLLRYGAAADGTYTFADKVLAVRSLLNSVSRLAVGGEAYPSLVGVRSEEDGSVTFRLKYVYRGILLTADESDVSVTVSGNAVTGVVIRSLFCDGGYLERPVISGLSAELMDHGEMTDDYLAVFRSDPATGLVSVVWVAREKGESTP